MTINKTGDEKIAFFNTDAQFEKQTKISEGMQSSIRQLEH